MEVKVCKNCRKLFNYIYGPELCINCIKLISHGDIEKADKQLFATIEPTLKEDEDMLVQVREYIMANPKATILQISEINKLSPTKLFEWIREERLEFSEDSKYAWFECEKCGTKIKSGRLCVRCKIL